MISKSFSEFIRNKYKGCKKPFILPGSMMSRMNLLELFQEDFEEYEKYLQSLEEVKTTPKYSL